MPIVIVTGGGSPSGSLTRTNLRRKVSENAGGYLLGSVLGSPTPSVGQVAAAEFIDSRVDNSYYVGSHVYHPSTAVMGTGDTVDRIVASYTSSNGLVVPHRPFGSAPPIGGDLELHRHSVDKIHKAINAGLERCEFEYIIAIPANSDNAQTYSLAGYSDVIKGRRNILGVYPASPGIVDTDQLPQEMEWWDIQFDGTDWQLRLGSPLWSTATLWVHVLTGYPPLNVDTDTTACPEEWAIAASMVMLYQRMMDETGTNRESSVYTTNRARWMATFRHLSQLHGVKRHDKINYSVPEWGPVWGQGLRRRGIV